MFKILKQIRNGQAAYSIRNKTPGSNDHIIHVGGGVYINKVYPEVYPMQEVADGFNSMEDAEAAVEMLIKIDQMIGIKSWRATSQRPLLRVA